MRAVEEAAAMASETVVHEREIAEVGRWMDEVDGRPSAVVVDMDGSAPSVSSLALRAEHSTLALPIVGVTMSVDDLVFEDAYAAGIDDVCASEGLVLGRRFRRLAGVEPGHVEHCGKQVVIADKNRDTRMLIGRVFRDAGYGVVFAADGEHARDRARDSGVAVVVVSSEIDLEDGSTMSRHAAQEGIEAVWLINTPPKEIPSVRSRLGLASSTKVAVHDAYASPASLLFLANELLNRPLSECRGSERLLYGASVRFRHAGRDDQDVGYLFNVSADGLYVCTLAPPDSGDELWLEFTPPRCDRRVHLEATAVWARRFGPGHGATVPCGFGAKIEGGSRADLARYSQGYATFLGERAALHDGTGSPRQRPDRELPKAERPTVRCGRGRRNRSQPANASRRRAACLMHDGSM